MNQSDFLKLNVNDRANVVWEKGEFIGSREYYGYKVVLYVLKGLYIEVWYFKDTNKIEKVEPIEDERHLKQYVNIDDILKGLNT